MTAKKIYIAADIISELIKKGKIEEALEMLEKLKIQAVKEAANTWF